jgi:hypothetical protein
VITAAAHVAVIAHDPTNWDGTVDGWGRPTSFVVELLDGHHGEVRVCQ